MQVKVIGHQFFILHVLLFANQYDCLLSCNLLCSSVILNELQLQN